MDNSLKAALLSGLVFPGLGQIYLKHYTRGVIIISVAVTGLALVIVEAVRILAAIMDRIVSLGEIINMETVSAAAQATVNSFRLGMGLILIILSLIIGTFDAYMVGKREDQ